MNTPMQYLMKTNSASQNKFPRNLEIFDAFEVQREEIKHTCTV